MTPREWDCLVLVFDRIQKLVRSAYRRATETGLTAEEDQLFDWALEFTLYQVKGYLKITSDPERAAKLVEAVLFRRMVSELLRRVRKGNKSKNSKLEDCHPEKPSGTVEALVAGLNLKPDQEALLLKVIYKRSGEKLRQRFSSETEEKQWRRLRDQLASGGVF